MRQAVLRLDEATIEALADYIGTLPAVASTPPPDWETVSADILASAQSLALNGDDDRNLPSCASCHIDASDGLRVIPRLTGQQPAYLFERLQHFGDEEATNEIGNSPMRTISSSLTVEERRGLAEYFSRQNLPVKPN